MAGKPRKRFTAEEYLSLERAAAEKSEFYEGEIFAMSGANEEHNAITANLIALLRPGLLKSGCQTYPPDMKVAITPLGPFFYPDVSVACGPRQYLDGRRDVLLNPVLIVEVLSRSTQRYDREIKLPAYQRVASVESILLVSAERPAVDAYFRSARGWKHQAVTGIASALTVPAPSIGLTLKEIYAGVVLTKPARN